MTFPVGAPPNSSLLGSIRLVFGSGRCSSLLEEIQICGDQGMKKILFIFTGGTISMRIDPLLGAAVLVLSGEEILSFVPNLDQLAHFEVLDFA